MIAAHLPDLTVVPSTVTACRSALAKRKSREWGCRARVGARFESYARVECDDDGVRNHGRLALKVTPDLADVGEYLWALIAFESQSVSTDP